MVGLARDFELWSHEESIVTTWPKSVHTHSCVLTSASWKLKLRNPNINTSALKSKSKDISNQSSSCLFGKIPRLFYHLSYRYHHRCRCHPNMRDVHITLQYMNSTECFKTSNFKIQNSNFVNTVTSLLSELILNVVSLSVIVSVSVLLYCCHQIWYEMIFTDGEGEMRQQLENWILRL